ncbi:MAG: hypothetical protein WCB68_15495 [Pyrinomonadaceae bacterium]
MSSSFVPDGKAGNLGAHARERRRPACHERAVRANKSFFIIRR